MQTFKESTENDLSSPSTLDEGEVFLRRFVPLGSPSDNYKSNVGADS